MPRDRHQNDPGGAPTPEPSRDEGPRPSWGENVGERRRREAVRLVQARVAEVVATVTGRVPGAGLLTTAATCAEARLDDERTTHRFTRIGLVVEEEAIAAVRTTLLQAGWHETVPGTDSGIISIAHAQGRRPHFVVLDGERDRLDGPGAPHPASDEGRAIRTRRLRATLVPPSLVLGLRTRVDLEPGVEIETLEVQVRSVDR
ncbi:MAG: hypothetical protein VX726_11050 [Planctomycetota bacterium]|nr:hypothetical protein [Planctomycetota bacterium]